MSRNEPEGAHGFLDERVQHRDPEMRMRNPGRIVFVPHVVTVEYNDYDGNGPYEVQAHLSDLVRPFTPFCEARVKVRGGDGIVTCGTPVDFRGDCYRAGEHVKEAQK